MPRKPRKNQNLYDPLPFSQTWRTAIYARLSREDLSEKDTIESQIEWVKDYLKSRPMFDLIDVYADNGYSGSNFARPQFEQLMEDIRNRKIDCIIVKDLSRFAREYIDAEDYLNNIFPFLGIRFIAILDGYDNINIKPQEYFLASFRNLANAHFAKETSRKTIEAKRILQEQGKYIGAFPPFGYKKDPADKHKLIIDDEKAEIVREIFKRNADGESYSTIRDDLNNRKITTNRGCLWTSSRVRNMLITEAYIGTLAQRRSTKSLYNGEEMRLVPKDEQIRFENAFEPIIEREIWDKVQSQMIERKLQVQSKRAKEGGDSN
jgi:DNA invertase Pin-like site-specific DNA recombinase